MAQSAPEAVQATQAPTSLKPFLEHRVAEELVNEGIMLSRRNLALSLEQDGGTWIVALTDLATQRVAASTKVDALPDDREAAVAALTQVAGELAARTLQLAAPGLSKEEVDQEIERRTTAALADHVKAERTFDGRKLSLGSELRVFASGSTTTTTTGTVSSTSVSIVESWVPYEGGEQIEPEAFYTTIGRADLVKRYRDRRSTKYATWIGGAALATGSMIWLLRNMHEHSQCTAASFEGGTSDCPSAVTPAPIVLGVVGLLAGYVGVYLHLHPQPISREQARQLIQEYNDKLRSELELARRAPVLRDIRFAPYAVPGGGGLVVAARF